jgi:hypothetical protein
VQGETSATLLAAAMCVMRQRIKSLIQNLSSAATATKSVLNLSIYIYIYILRSVAEWPPILQVVPAALRTVFAIRMVVMIL